MLVGSRERDLLENGLAQLGFQSAPIDSLLGLARSLDSWRARQNLTAHQGVAVILERLILDAAALAGVLPQFACFADIGSGAGFPGLPIAILFPERRLVSIEARAKRVYFQRAVVRELELGNVEIIHGRAEATRPRMRDLVIAQAVAAPERALDWMLPWCADGGWLAIPLSESQPEPAQDPRVQAVEIRNYRVPPTAASRRVWLARRAG